MISQMLSSFQPDIGMFCTGCSAKHDSVERMSLNTVFDFRNNMKNSFVSLLLHVWCLKHQSLKSRSLGIFKMWSASFWCFNITRDIKHFVQILIIKKIKILDNLWSFWKHKNGRPHFKNGKTRTILIENNKNFCEIRGRI